MLETDGERYEYEMNVLMVFAREKIPIKEVWIETVYLNDNSSSHFNTIKDSYRIYKEIIKFSGSSFLSFCLDYLLYCIFFAVTGILVFSNVAARVISAIFNYTLNRKVVFKSRTSLFKSALEYTVLSVFILLCNTLLLKAFNGMGLNGYLAKIPAEIIMFVVSWTIQRRFIFKSESKQKLDPVCEEVQYAGNAVYENSQDLGNTIPENVLVNGNTVLENARDHGNRTLENVQNYENNGHMKGGIMRKHKWAIAYSLCLIAFTTYISLNTFVLSSTYRSDACICR